MRSDPDGVLLGASVAFAGASVVAIRDQLPGEPLGVSISLSVPAGLLAGWGAAVAAPWPMPVAAVTAAAAARRREQGAGPGAVCAAIGLGCVVGTVIEPVPGMPPQRAVSAACVSVLPVADTRIADAIRLYTR